MTAAEKSIRVRNILRWKRQFFPALSSMAWIDSRFALEALNMWTFPEDARDGGACFPKLLSARGWEPTPQSSYFGGDRAPQFVASQSL